MYFFSFENNCINKRNIFKHRLFEEELLLFLMHRDFDELE